MTNNQLNEDRELLEDKYNWAVAFRANIETAVKEAIGGFGLCGHLWEKVILPEVVKNIQPLLDAQSRIERARAIEIVELQFKNIFTNWSAKNKKRACKDGLELIKQKILSDN